MPQRNSKRLKKPVMVNTDRMSSLMWLRAKVPPFFATSLRKARNSRRPELPVSYTHLTLPTT